MQENIKKIDQYIDILMLWNQKISLISTKDADNINTLKDRHINNSILFLPFIQQYTNKHNMDIYDIGSGGGLPAIILAILDSKNRYNLVEPNNKKCTFLSFIKSELNLTNVNILTNKIENISSNIADIVTSRAFSSLTTLAKASYPILKKGSSAFFIKGESYTTELEELYTTQINNNYKITIHNISNSQSTMIEMFKLA